MSRDLRERAAPADQGADAVLGAVDARTGTAILLYPVFPPDRYPKHEREKIKANEIDRPVLRLRTVVRGE